MKYCKTCKQLCFGESIPFDGCKHKYRVIEDINEPVRLCVAGGTERAMITGMLKDAEIPYVEEPVYPQGVANEIVTGYDVKLSNISVVVPFSALPEAIELVGAIETLPNVLEPHIDEITAEIAHLKAEKDKADNMNPALRTTIKVLSVLVLLALIALAVFGTDALTAWFKTLFQ